MNYTLHQLQVFLKISETKSVTKAAQELFLTQPAVSIQLKNFQEQFEIPLTELIGRKLHLTEFGIEIAKAAEKIIHEVHAINYKTLAHQGLLSGKLRISVVSTGKYIMPYLLSDFMKNKEGIELFMDVNNRAHVLESIQNSQVDFALVSLPLENFSAESINLFPNELYLVVGANTTLSKKGMKIQEMNQIPLIFREHGSGSRTLMEEFLNIHEIKVKRKFELTTHEAVKQAVISGLGYSIMPLIGIRNEIRLNQLKIVPIKGLPLRTNWHLIWLKNKHFTPVASAFLAYMKKNKTDLIKRHFAPE